MKQIKFLTETTVEKSIEKWLPKKGWRVLPRPGRFGVDIRAQHVRWRKYFLIEAKGDSLQPVVRNNNFLGAVGELIIRMDTKRARYLYGLGFPISFKKLVFRRMPWTVAQKLNIHLLFVDQRRNVIGFTWSELRRAQKK